jgi:hypothetical protein
MGLEKIPVLEKITKLKTRLYGADQDDLSQVDQWERDAKTALITDNLQEHEGIKIIIDQFISDIKDIDEVLTTAYSVELSDKDRDRLLDNKKFIQKFIDLFEVARSTVTELEARVDNELDTSI